MHRIILSLVFIDPFRFFMVIILESYSNMRSYVDVLLPGKRSIELSSYTVPSFGLVSIVQGNVKPLSLFVSSF